VVKDAFWKLLIQDHIRTSLLFPTLHQKGCASLDDAQFDFLPDSASRGLRQLLLRLFPKIVRLPPSLHIPFQQMAKTTNVCTLNDKFLCGTFQDEKACAELEAELCPKGGKAY
jgi:hypothetical protein